MQFSLTRQRHGSRRNAVTKDIRDPMRPGRYQVYPRPTDAAASWFEAESGHGKNWHSCFGREDGKNIHGQMTRRPGLMMLIATLNQCFLPTSEQCANRADKEYFRKSGRFSTPTQRFRVELMAHPGWSRGGVRADMVWHGCRPGTATLS